MKAIRILLTLLLFVASISCKQEKHLETATVNTDTITQDTLPNPNRKKPYIKIEDLHTYADNAPTIERPENMGKPFDKLIFDKVIAYDYEGSGEPYPSIIEEGDFNPVVLKQKILNTEQVNKLIKSLTTPSSYGGTSASCFDPHLAFLFYKDNKIVYTIDICLDCNRMSTTTEIPAIESFKREYPFGFSLEGKRDICALCREFNFYYGSDTYIKKIEKSPFK
ncbi:hypothetical protein ACLI1A_06380 [Flavobacterium sp. RHBU_3]|uniref:hypothetical protein n=1 Tax=Flavobacterium sp. RHBU_3 TaxID=3391184 RepID=UPI0039852420